VWKGGGGGILGCWVLVRGKGGGGGRMVGSVRVGREGGWVVREKGENVGDCRMRGIRGWIGVVAEIE